VTAFALLTLGVVLARRRRYDAHRWVQTGAVALTLVPILVWMLASLRANIVPDLPGDLRHPAFAMATVHVVLGAVATVFGVVLVARATQLYIGRRNMAAYRTPMRLAYLLYLAATAAGVVVYVVTYG
jgi:uncharacterized membrane protein YozB (DUF420 family)